MTLEIHCEANSTDVVGDQSIGFDLVRTELLFLRELISSSTHIEMAKSVYV